MDDDRVGIPGIGTGQPCGCLSSPTIENVRAQKKRRFRKGALLRLFSSGSYARPPLLRRRGNYRRIRSRFQPPPDPGLGSSGKSVQYSGGVRPSEG